MNQVQVADESYRLWMYYKGLLSQADEENAPVSVVVNLERKLKSAYENHMRVMDKLRHEMDWQ